MGTSHSVPEFRAKINRAAAALEADTPKIAKEATLAVAASITALAEDATGGDLNLSGVRDGGKRGGEVGVIAAAFGRSGSITTKGPWHLIESDTSPHDIDPGATDASTGRRRDAGTGRFRKASVALAFLGGFFARAHNTGGSTGKHPFAEGVIAAEPVVLEGMGVIVHSTLAAALH